MIALGVPALLASPFACKSGEFWNRRGTIDVVMFDPTGRLIAIGGRDVGTGSYDDHGDVKIRDAYTGELQGAIAVPRRVYDLAWSADASVIVLGTRSSRVVGKPEWTIYVFRVPPDGDPAKIHEESFQFVPKRGFTFVGDVFVVAGEDQAWLWDAKTWKVTGRLPGVIEAFATDGHRGGGVLATVDEVERKVRLWGAPQLNPRAKFSGRAPVGENANLLVYKAATSDELLLRQLSTNKLLLTLPESAGPWIDCEIALSGALVVAWSEEGLVRLWDITPAGASARASITAPRVLRCLPPVQPDTLIAITKEKTLHQVRPDGSSRPVKTDPGGVELWGLTTAMLLRRFRESEAAQSSNLLATYFSAGGERVYVWDISDPGNPQLVWRDRWRNRLRSLIPGLE
ncbi:MAG: WD40 repeat domain-containing protein [bacterium]|nr:WD40 repeat domain-containing protein [bacterium]